MQRLSTQAETIFLAMFAKEVCRTRSVQLEMVRCPYGDASHGPSAQVLDPLVGPPCSGADDHSAMLEKGLNRLDLGCRRFHCALRFMPMDSSAPL